MNLAINGLVQRFADPRSGMKATVLDGLDLVTGDIQALVLVGPSGGGKSTLLRILAGLDVPAAGTVAFDGEPLPQAENALIGYRRTVGTVFQAYNLFPHLTAMQNLLLPLVHVHGLAEAEARERVREPLERFGLASHAHKRPAELSGGQKQRVAILRALVVRPRRLFLDEPTSALDPISTAKVEELVSELKKEYTVAIVTHNMQQAARVSDFTAYMYLGELVEFGQTEQIFMKPAKQETEDYITGRFG